MPSGHEVQYSGDGDNRKHKQKREAATAAGRRGFSPAAPLAGSSHLAAVARLAFEPAGLGNTAGSTLQGELETGGLDTLDVALWGEWDRQQHEALCLRLRGCQAAARVDEEAARCLVLPGGQRASVRKGGCPYGNSYMHYVLDVGGLEIAISEQWEQNENRPQVLVSLGSALLMQIGHVAAWEECKQILAGLGFRVTDSCVSRVDGCSDHPGVDSHEFAAAMLASRRVSRVRKFGLFLQDDRLTGFSGGKSTRVRVYCKATELRDKPDAVKQQILEARRWGGPQEKALRVEFQLRRESLRKNFDVRTVEEVFAALPTIFAWCSQEWFRLTAEPVVRNHTDRAETWSAWRQVVEAFQSWTGDVRSERKRPVPTQPDKMRLLKQAVGCLSSACALAGDVPASVQGFLETVEEMTLPLLRNVTQRVREKRQLLESLVVGADRSRVAAFTAFDQYNAQARAYNRQHEAEHYFDGIRWVQQRKAEREQQERERPAFVGWEMFEPL